MIWFSVLLPVSDSLSNKHFPLSAFVNKCPYSNNCPHYESDNLNQDIDVEYTY